MRTPITLRLDTTLLEAARAEARRDSRTLTNFIEVALRKRLGMTEQEPAASGRGQDVAATNGGSPLMDKPPPAGRVPGSGMASNIQR